MRMCALHSVNTNAKAANLPPPPPAAASAAAAAVPAPLGPQHPNAVAEVVTKQLALAAAACGAATEAVTQAFAQPTGDFSHRALASLAFAVQAAMAAASAAASVEGVQAASLAQVPGLAQAPHQVQEQEPQVTREQLRQLLPQNQQQKQPRPTRPEEQQEKQQKQSNQLEEQPEAQHKARPQGTRVAQVLRTAHHVVYVHRRSAEPPSPPGPPAACLNVALTTPLWKQVELRWTFVRPDRCPGSSLQELTGVNLEALQALRGISAVPNGATCLADCKWDTVVKRILHKYNGPYDPEGESCGGWVWATKLAPLTNAERKQTQELGGWALDYCFTELQARRAFKPVAREPAKILYQAVGNWGVYRLMAGGLAGALNAVNVGDIFECAGTQCLANEDWRGLQRIMQHIQHVALKPEQGFAPWEPPANYLDGLNPTDPTMPW